MTIALSLASIVLSLCVIGHLYRLHRRLEAAERAYQSACELLKVERNLASMYRHTE
jgi:hypothetical protein